MTLRLGSNFGTAPDLPVDLLGIVPEFLALGRFRIVFAPGCIGHRISPQFVYTACAVARY